MPMKTNVKPEAILCNNRMPTDGVLITDTIKEPAAQLQLGSFVTLQAW